MCQNQRLHLVIAVSPLWAAACQTCFPLTVWQDLMMAPAVQQQAALSWLIGVAKGLLCKTCTNFLHNLPILWQCVALLVVAACCLQDP